MPNDMSVAAVGAISSAYEAGSALQQVAAPAPSTETATNTSVASVLPGLPNPTIQLDPAVNLVVVQLHNRQGEVISSIPTQRHLEAYRLGILPIPANGLPPAVPTAPAEPTSSANSTSIAAAKPVVATPHVTPVLPHLAPAPVSATAGTAPVGTANTAHASQAVAAAAAAAVVTPAAAPVAPQAATAITITAPAPAVTAPAAPAAAPAVPSAPASQVVTPAPTGAPTSAALVA